KMATTGLEAVIEFHNPPELLFANPETPSPRPNHLRFRLGGKDEGISLSLQAKVPGGEIITRPVDLGFTYDSVFGMDRMEAYERLLGDAIDGHPALFAREDSVEQTWRIVMPALEHPSKLRFYESGSWEADEAAE